MSSMLIYLLEDIKMKHIVVLLLALTTVLGGVPKITKIDSSLSWRVVGGSDASDGQYPHQVSLQYYGFHSCGGSIVNSEWIITAAHCVRGDSPSDWEVLAGTNKLSSGGTSYAVRELYYHENYDPSTGENDVAILKVDPITFTDKVQPIAAQKEDVGGDVDVILSGWGSLSVGGASPDNLQHLNLKTTTVEYCKSRHSVRPVFESSVCTLTVAGEGACHGDSGGPLISTGDEKTLVGIVSWGQPCARGYPDVFARVSSFVDWFNNICNCL